MPTPEHRFAVKRISSLNLLALAFLNARRHGLRAAVNVAGIAIAVASLVFFLSFYRGTYQGVMFSSVIDFATSHGQFMGAAFDDDDPDSWLDGSSLLDGGLASNGRLLGAAPAGMKEGRTILAPRLMSPAFAGDGSRKASVLLAGVAFEQEAKVLSIAARLVSGSFGADGVIIGKKLAQTLSLGVGDEIRLQATTANGAPNLDYWRIAGIYSTGYPPMDRGMVMMDITQAQDFLDASGKINKIYSRFAAASDSVARERGISSLETDMERERLAGLGLVFKSWKNYAKSIVEDAKKDGIFYVIFIGVLLFLSLSTMAGTMRVTVFERKREIGMMRASGWMRSEVLRLYLYEALAIGIAGGAIGCLSGGLVSLALQLNPIEFGASMASLDIPSFSLTCDLQAVDAIVALACGLITAVLAGMAPALSGARMPIIAALSERQE